MKYQDQVIAELEKLSAHKYRSPDSHCCWTWKDADLEPWGRQFCHLDSIKDGIAWATVESFKLFVGYGVTLNIPDNSSSPDQDRCLDLYMEQAEMTVSGGCPIHIEFDGDDWMSSSKEVIGIPITAKGWFRKKDYAATKVKYVAPCDAARSIMWASKQSLERWELCVKEIDQQLNMASGWMTYKEGAPVCCKPGKPGPESAWAVIEAMDKGAYKKGRRLNDR